MLAATSQARMGIGEGERVSCSGHQKCIKSWETREKSDCHACTSVAQAAQRVFTSLGGDPTFTMVSLRLKMYNSGPNSYNNDTSNVIMYLQTLQGCSLCESTLIHSISYSVSTCNDMHNCQNDTAYVSCPVSVL
jgi:hypothetical protein